MPIKVVTLKPVERLVGWVDPQPEKGPTPIIKKCPKGEVFEIPDEQKEDAQTLIDAGYVALYKEPAPDKAPVKPPAA